MSLALAYPSQKKKGKKKWSSYHKAQRFTFELLHTVEIETKLEYVVRATVTAVIFLSIISVMLETVEEINAQYHQLFSVFEVISVAIFTIEYLLRLWSVVLYPKYEHWFFGRIRYVISPMALIDLLSIFPFYAPQLIHSDLRFIRGLRLIRLLSVLKFGHYSNSLHTIARVISRKKHEIGASLIMITLLLIMSSSLMYFIEHEAQPKAFPSIPASIWWGVATLTTVGYGDVYPITTLGKICAAVITILGISVLTLPSGLVVTGFIEELQKKSKPTCPKCGEVLN